MEKLRLDDFKNYHFLSQLKCAPNSGVSSVVAAKANEKNGYNSAIYVKRCDEQGYVRLTSSTGRIGTYAWLDDNHIVFSANRDADKAKAIENGEEITSFYKISLCGGEAEELFSVDLKVTEIQPMEGGKFLLKAVYDNNRPDLSGLEPHEKQKALEEIKKKKAYQVVDELPFWANGQGFTNKLRNRLYIYCPECGLKAITPELREVDSYKFTPCKNYIVYKGEDFENVHDLKETVYIYSLETGETNTVLSKEFYMGSMDTYKDQLIFAGTKGEKYGSGENPHFYSLNLKTGEVKLIAEYTHSICSATNTDNRLGGGTTFKVYKDDLYFTSLIDFYTDIFKLNLESGEITKVTDCKGAVDFFAVCDCGIEAVALKDNRLQEVYAVKDGAMELISAFNDEIYKNKIYQVPEYHQFTNEHGTVLDGWAIMPVGYDENKKYPAILNIHGGPKTAFGDIYFHEMQYWAAEGYVVIYCNPTGGDGKGNDFADIRGKYGTVDYDDLMLFVDEMVKKYPVIDEGKLGVTGGSYGGFMTNWMIGHTDRFAAAASQRSIANWIGFTYICDIGYHFGVNQMQADAWSNVDKLWWHSPLKYADKAKTPTLFIHSDQDYRCWVPEAIQMYTALKLHGVETKMCIFHGENHELSRSGKPENRIGRLTEITGWMDKYLK